MSVHSVLLGALAGLVALRICGADRRWPWRVLDLVPATDAPEPGPRRPQERAHERHRRGGRDDEALERDLPIVVQLLHLAVTAGHSLHTAVAAVAEVSNGPAGAALAHAVEAHRRGARLVDCLERLPERHGVALRPLTTTLVVAASSGAPLAPALQRLADVERRRLRRRTEERVRRLPVLLLAPLVGLILPAFVLLAIVPVGLTTARDGLAPLSGTSFPSTGDPPRSPP